jgi:MoaA/NifB/PqqE/SkfB family radical SAM enzyme
MSHESQTSDPSSTFVEEMKASNSHYGFYGRLKEEFPSQVIIDTTELCNLACVHCPHPTFKESEHYKGRSLEPDLNKKAVDEVREFGKDHAQYIRYTGEGETLIHKHFFEMLSYATSHSGVPVTVTTNGVLLNESRCEKLLSTHVDIVDISIDAFSPETYAKLRVHGDLNITRANVLRLLHEAKSPHSKTKVIVSYIEQPLNQNETCDFKSFWEEQGADYVVIRRLHSAAGAVPNIAEQMRQEFASEARHPCLYPWERVVLNPRGHLAFCPADWTHGSTMLDYRHTTIRETWRGEFYKKLRQAHLSNQFCDHAFCGQCPDWKMTRWPGEGRSYADMVTEFKETE